MRKRSHDNNEDDDEQPINQQEYEQEAEEPPHSQTLQFGSHSVPIKCPFCFQQINTQIIAKPELVSIVLGLALFTLMPNAVMIVLVVIILQVTATKKHRCSLCERELGTDGKFLVCFKDQVYSFSLGETGVLISKKILVTGGLVVSIFLVLMAKSTMTDPVVWSGLTWEQYKTQCPVGTISTGCTSDMEEKAVLNWKGFVMRVQDERQSMHRFYETAVIVFVKMNPSEEPDDKPDLVLTGSTSAIYEFGEALDNLRHGDEIVFNATFRRTQIRARQNFNGRHLHINEINQTGIHSDQIEVYVRDTEQAWVQNNVQGKGLRVQPEMKQLDQPEIKQLDQPEMKQLDQPEMKQLDQPEIKQLDQPEIKQLDQPEIKQLDQDRENQAQKLAQKEGGSKQDLTAKEDSR